MLRVILSDLNYRKNSCTVLSVANSLPVDLTSFADHFSVKKIGERLLANWFNQIARLDFFDRSFR